MGVVQRDLNPPRRSSQFVARAGDVNQGMRRMSCADTAKNVSGSASDAARIDQAQGTPVDEGVA
jgi:hypothetical protein